jgi:hypothetical protein
MIKYEKIRIERNFIRGVIPPKILVSSLFRGIRGNSIKQMQNLLYLHVSETAALSLNKRGRKIHAVR